MSRITRSFVLFASLLCIKAYLPVQASPQLDLAVLTLGAAEEIAGRLDPLVDRFRRLAAARRQAAVADGQLPDPKLKLGLANFPTEVSSAPGLAKRNSSLGLRWSYRITSAWPMI